MCTLFITMKTILLAAVSTTFWLSSHAFVTGLGGRTCGSTAVAGYKNSVTASYLDSLSTPRVVTLTTTKVAIDEKIDLLDDALQSNTSAAAMLLAKLGALEGSDREAFVSSLLSEIDNPVPWWSRIRPLTRFSRRARRASLRRVLDLSTPAASEQEQAGDDLDQRSRRRSLVIILRSLAKQEDEGDEAKANNQSGNHIPAIVSLEKVARREARATIRPQDMLNRLPKGLETPRYTVVVERPQFEVRRYDPFSVCSVAMNKPRPAGADTTDAKISNPQLVGASSFGALAGYLFGKNQQQTSMKMTTPVLSSGEGDARQMSFVLPSDYWQEDGLDSAPKPLAGSGVILERDEGGERAVVMFGGFATKQDVEAKTQQLLEGLRKDKEWQAARDASVCLAQYNDPFTPPWKRRNEVSIKAIPLLTN